MPRRSATRRLSSGTSNNGSLTGCGPLPYLDCSDGAAVEERPGANQGLRRVRSTAGPTRLCGLMLSYPFSWLPVIAVISLLVLLSTYLALIALAVMAVLTLALVVALTWLAATMLYALGIAAPTEPPADRAQRQHRGRLPV